MLLNCGVGEDSWELLDCKEIQPVHPKGNLCWIFIGRTDAEAETPILWPPHAKSWLIGKDPDAGKDWRQVERGMTEDQMVGCHHWLNGHEFELNSRSWWRTGRPDVLQSMESQRVGHDWATELNWMSYKAFPDGSVVKSPPAMQEPQETRVCSLGWEDLLEEGLETLQSSCLEDPHGQRSLVATVHGVA